MGAKRRRAALSDRLASASGSPPRTWFTALPESVQAELVKVRKDYHSGGPGSQLSMADVARIILDHLADEHGIELKVKRQQIAQWLANGKTKHQAD